MPGKEGKGAEETKSPKGGKDAKDALDQRTDSARWWFRPTALVNQQCKYGYDSILPDHAH